MSNEVHDVPGRDQLKLMLGLHLLLHTLVSGRNKCVQHLNQHQMVCTQPQSIIHPVKARAPTSPPAPIIEETCGAQEQWIKHSMYATMHQRWAVLSDGAVTNSVMDHA